MSNTIDPNDFALYKNLQKYLNTRIETSRGIVNIREEERVPFGQRRKPARIVQYDCHDIKVTVSNTAPTEPRFPAVVFMGLALFVNFKDNEEKILRRWNDMKLPKVDLNNAPQSVDDIRITSRNYFPRGNKKYFPVITEGERSHGYYLLSGQSITYDMNVLLAECLDLDDMKLWVEGTISRRHLFHCQKEIML